MLDERSSGEDVPILEVPGIGRLSGFSISGRMGQDVREYAVKSEMTWIRSG